MPDKAFLVDTTRCNGCRSCQVACKQWNDLPGEETDFFTGKEYTSPVSLSAVTWNHVIFSDVIRNDSKMPEWNILHKKCFHCKEANCIVICPVKAISNINGWIIIDQDKCNSCGFCTDVCVYKVPHLSKKEYKNVDGDIVIKNKKAYKCNACTVKAREIPSCASNCPTGAISYGYRLVILKEANSRLKKIKKKYLDASIYGVWEFGGLRSITLLKKSPADYGLPVGKDAEQIKI